ncbi:hypothetical protein ASG43_17450 [Aureimonas sp. Leaf454]|uniref:TniQ family protein n=1 Tax=Aureimonas sp. Leaf454 TaxID=1736381 RepID=UPI0006FD0AB9|nr:TniQ family protein [Aureimonas sp. Leaf454]KQT42061.1 hypothetical protein ASG43_17450 [Aureimonas sp. Leaf454]
MVAASETIRGIRFHEGEPAAWLMVRMAEWLGDTVDEFAAKIGFPFAEARRGLRNAELAGLVGKTPEAVAAWTPMEAASGKSILRGQVLRMSWDWVHPTPGLPVQACPTCLRTDLAEGEGPKDQRPFVRAWWCLRDISHCQKHGTYLVGKGRPAPDVDGHRDLDDDPRFWYGLHMAPAVQVPDADRMADLYLLGRLGVVQPTPVPFLDRLDIGEASSVISWLAELATVGTKPLDTRAMTRVDAMRVRSLGLALAKDWPNRINVRLDELLEANEGPRRGPNSVYGRFYTRVYDIRDSKEDHAGRKELREVLWDHAMRRIPFGVGERMYGIETDESERVSVAGAVDIAGVPKCDFLRFAESFGLMEEGVDVRRFGVARSVAEAVRGRLLQR